MEQSIQGMRRLQKNSKYQYILLNHINPTRDEPMNMEME
jgi:hypothetical protein